MKELKIDTGLQTFSLNGKAEVSFNPSDTVFIKGLYDVFSDLEKKQAEYEEESEKVSDDPIEVFEFSNKKDKEMRAVIDGFFNMEICEPLYGSMNVYAFSNNGLPLWMEFFLAILDECNANLEDIAKKGNARVEKYIKKYQRKK